MQPLIKPDVVIIEDDQDFCFLVEKAMEQIDKGIKLTFINDGRRGLEFLNTNREKNIVPGMILLDLYLPGLSGLDLLRQIKGINFFKQVPVILFTTSDSAKDKKTALEYCANAYYTKPPGYNDLINTLRSLLENYFHTTLNKTRL